MYHFFMHTRRISRSKHAGVNEVRKKDEAFGDVIKLAEDRRVLMLKLFDDSRDEIAKAIYMLGSEICEFQKMFILWISTK